MTTSAQNKQLLIAISKMGGPDKNDRGVVKLTKFKKMSSQDDLDSYGDFMYIDDSEDELVCGNSYNQINTSVVEQQKCSDNEDEPPDEVDSCVSKALVLKSDSIPSAVDNQESNSKKCPNCQHDKNQTYFPSFSSEKCLCICHIKMSKSESRNSFPLDSNLYIKRIDRARTLDVIRSPPMFPKEALITSHSIFDGWRVSKILDLAPSFALFDLKSKKNSSGSNSNNSTLPVLTSDRFSSRKYSNSLTLPDLKARRKSEAINNKNFIRSNSERARRSSDCFDLKRLESFLLANKLKPANECSVPAICNTPSSSSSSINQVISKSDLVVSKCNVVAKPSHNSNNKNDSNCKVVNNNINGVTNNKNTNVCQQRKISEPILSKRIETDLKLENSVKLRRNSASASETSVTNRNSSPCDIMDYCSNREKRNNLDYLSNKDRRRLSEAGLPLDLTDLLQVGEDLLDHSPVKTLNILTVRFSFIND